MKKLFIGNIPWKLSENELRDLFEQHGDVASCKIIMDRDTGRSKGFGFVEYNDAADADSATEALNNFEVEGKKLVVNEAKPQEKKSFGSRPRAGGGRRY